MSLKITLFRVGANAQAVQGGVDGVLAHGPRAPRSSCLIDVFAENLRPNAGSSLMKCRVIEDDTQTGYYICNSLRESGHEVVHSQDARDGLEQALRGVWDMMILDHLLPGGFDGLTIVGHTRALHIVTPVLVISALTAIDERVRGLRAGGDDYLSKPLAMLDLGVLPRVARSSSKEVGIELATKWRRIPV